MRTLDHAMHVFRCEAGHEFTSCDRDHHAEAELIATEPCSHFEDAIMCGRQCKLVSCPRGCRGAAA